MLKVIELFAGVGSQTQALKNIGVEHEVVAISDNDMHADKTYRALHDPDVNNLGDITKIQSLPKADLWTYSFPCQDISVAGLQRGLDQGSGTRSGLLWEVERLLIKAKEQGTLPKYLLLENVKNLIGKKFKDNYEKWLSFLSSLGYTTYTKVLNAKDFGVPQNRELKIRLKDILENNVEEKYYLKASTIISILNTTFNQRAGLLHGGNDVCATLCARDYREPKLIAVGKLEGGVWDKRYNQIRQVFDPNGISPTIMAGGGGGTETKIIAIRGREQGQVIEPNDKGTSNALTTVQKDNLVMEKPNKLVCRGYKKFTDKNGYIPELFNPYHGKEIKDIAPTQTTKCGIDTSTATVLKAEKQIDCIRIRKLTPTECWRLMGWNDEQIAKVKASGISNTQMYKQAGNGIVVTVLEAIFKNLFL
mgnify:FL=1